jgi:hypothetical protein
MDGAGVEFRHDPLAGDLSADNHGQDKEDDNECLSRSGGVPNSAAASSMGVMNARDTNGATRVSSAQTHGRRRTQRCAGCIPYIVQAGHAEEVCRRGSAADAFAPYRVGS